MRLGAVVVPMNPQLKEREVGLYLGDSGAGTIVAGHQFEEAATTGANDANAELILVEPGKLEERLGAAEPVTGRWASRSWRPWPSSSASRSIPTSCART